MATGILRRFVLAYRLIFDVFLLLTHTHPSPSVKPSLNNGSLTTTYLTICSCSTYVSDGVCDKQRFMLQVLLEPLAELIEQEARTHSRSGTGDNKVHVGQLRFVIPRAALSVPASLRYRWRWS